MMRPFRLFLGLLLVAVTGSSALAARIVIIKNSTHARYEDAARVISARLGDVHELRTVDLTGLELDGARKRGVAMMETSPDLLIALGDKALFLADNYMKPTPVIFAMVSNWQGLTLDRTRITGVSMQLDPETMASQIKMFLPDRRRVGVVYTKAAQAYVERAMLKAAQLQLTLMPVFVAEPSEFTTVMKAMAPVLDLFWLVEDPTIATAENLKALMETAADQTLPTLCHSPGLVSVGMTMSISPDREEVGRQIVEMIEAVLGGKSPADLAIAPPAKARITLNRGEIKALGLEIDPMLLSFTHQVDTATGRKGR